MELEAADRAGVALPLRYAIELPLATGWAGKVSPVLRVEDVFQTRIIVWELLSEVFYCVFHTLTYWLMYPVYQSYYLLSRDSYQKNLIDKRTGIGLDKF